MQNKNITRIVILTLLMISAITAFAEPMCDVEVCNRTKRWSLNVFALASDKLNENCYHINLQKADAVEKKELSSSHDISINLTKRSVTYIKHVGQCN